MNVERSFEAAATIGLERGRAPSEPQSPLQLGARLVVASVRDAATLHPARSAGDWPRRS